VVKIISREPAELHKAKAVVRSVSAVEGAVSAVVELLSGAVRHELPAASLQTVLPALGGRVAVVSGAYAGATGQLETLEAELFSARVRLAALSPGNARV
jgi:DNA/RNA-binding protein KIN17